MQDTLKEGIASIKIKIYRLQFVPALMLGTWSHSKIPADQNLG